MFKSDKIILLGVIISVLILAPTRTTEAFDPLDLVQVGAAFLTNLGVHESGHYIMGQMGGAEHVQLDFFGREGKTFFLGRATHVGLEPDSAFSYVMAGEVAASYLFEVTLRSHRTHPTTYNRSLLFFSGTDFLWYSLYAFYLSDYRDPHFDPVGISNITGLSPEAILSMAALQTALNAYRVYSGSNGLVPYFAIDKRWAEFGIKVSFQ